MTVDSRREADLREYVESRLPSEVRRELDETPGIAPADRRCVEQFLTQIENQIATTTRQRVMDVGQQLSQRRTDLSQAVENLYSNLRQLESDAHTGDVDADTASRTLLDLYDEMAALEERLDQLRRDDENNRAPLEEPVGRYEEMVRKFPSLRGRLRINRPPTAGPEF